MTWRARCSTTGWCQWPLDMTRTRRTGGAGADDDIRDDARPDLGCRSDMRTFPLILCRRFRAESKGRGGHGRWSGYDLARRGRERMAAAFRRSRRPDGRGGAAGGE